MTSFLIECYFLAQNAVPNQQQFPKKKSILRHMTFLETTRQRGS